MFKVSGRQLGDGFCLRTITLTLNWFTISPLGDPEFMSGKNTWVRSDYTQRLALFINRNCLEGWRIFEPIKPFDRSGNKFIFTVADAFTVFPPNGFGRRFD